MIAEQANLDNPEAVKAYIANKQCSEDYKVNLVISYGHYLKVNGMTWVKPRYRRSRGLPRPPTTEALTKIIADASPRYATIFTLLAETGAMPAELALVKPRDIDLDRAVIALKGLKGHQPRVLELKPRTVAMLTRFLSEDPQEKPFPSSKAMMQAWMRTRNRVAEKLSDPRLRMIRLYDLRHYYGTMTYHRTRDILYVKAKMGHSRIQTTLIYTQLVNLESDEWTSSVAKSVEEACKLVDAGFEYVCDFNGAKIFRKRK